MIANLASKKEVLEKKLKEKDGDIEALKEKQRMEKRSVAIQRYRMRMFAVLYFDLVAVMFGMAGRS